MQHSSALQKWARYALLALLLLPLAGHAQVGIGTPTPAASAALEIKSTAGGLLLPRMTAAQRAAIPSPTPGLLVFQTDGTQGVYYYIGSNWVNLVTSLIPNAAGEAGPSPAIAVTTLAGSGTQGSANGSATVAQFSGPFGVAVDPSNTFVYVADTYNSLIRKVAISTGAVTTLAGSGNAGFADGSAAAAQFGFPAGVAVDPSNTFVYVADLGNNRVRKVSISTGAVTTLAGSGNQGFADGSAATAQFNGVAGVAVDPSNTFVYVADQSNNRVRKVSISTGAVTTLAGSGNQGFTDGSATTAQFSLPAGVAVDPGNTFVYVADQSNNRIRKVTISTGAVTTLAGSGNQGFANGSATVAQFSGPFGVAVDPSNTFVYVADYSNNRIRKVTISTGAVITLAGTDTAGFVDNTGPTAQFSSPTGVAVSGSTVYVADQGNNRIRIVR